MSVGRRLTAYQMPLTSRHWVVMRVGRDPRSALAVAYSEPRRPSKLDEKLMNVCFEIEMLWTGWTLAETC